MNEEIILKMVEPYLKDLSITYEEFDNLFEMLSLKEQYGILDILSKNNIELRPDEEEDDLEITDEPSDEELATIEQDIDKKDTFEILYDDSIFANDEKEFDDVEIDSRSSYLEIKIKVKQSNEILCKLIQEGNEQAKQDLCIKNRRLVCKVAKKYERYFGNDLSFEDLEQAGMMGMLRAAEKFHIEYGYSFSTYAMWWIRQAITREVYDHGFTIRVPVHMMETIGKINVADRKLRVKSMTDSERIEEIAELLDVSVEYVGYCMAIQSTLLSDASLDTPIGEDEDIVLLDMIPEDSVLSVEDQVAANVLGEMLDEVIETLTPREKKVLELRFGLRDGRERTLENVGREFGLTRERIRQIEAKALRKLRHPSRSRKFRDFLE